MPPSVNPTAPLTPITLDRPRQLLFDFNALAEFEGATGKNALNLEVWNDPSATDVRALLWAGLRHEDPDLTLTEVGRWLSFRSIKDITVQIFQAMNGALPEPDPASGDAPPSAGEGEGEAGNVPFAG